MLVGDPANREINREFCRIRPLCTILKVDRRANSKACSRIPYVTEQGIMSAEQGILAQEQGILPIKSEITQVRVHMATPRLVSATHWNRADFSHSIRSKRPLKT